MIVHIEVDEQFDHYLGRSGNMLVWQCWLSVGCILEERYSMVQNMRCNEVALVLGLVVLDGV